MYGCNVGEDYRSQQELKNDREFSDDKLAEDTAIVDEVIGQYNDMKSELEP